MPPHATMRRLTPVLVVEAVEPCLPFWTDRLGFRRTAEVPGDGGRLAFAILEKDGVEVMYQTRASVLAEMPDAPVAGHSTALFIDVDDLAAVERAMAGADLVRARHETFYGTAEVYVREPGGTLVGFSQKL